MEGQSLYDRLGGVFPIAAVVDDFSERILDDPRVGRESPNPALRDWSRGHTTDRLPGLKWMRTLWVCAVAGGPQKYVPTRPGAELMGLENAHRDFHISPDEFDAVAEDLATTLDKFGIPQKEKGEVLTAFAAHKGEVTQGSRVGV